MPYLPENERTQYPMPVPQTVGELNYLITRLAISFVETQGLRYDTLNGVVGAIESAKQEFYNRVVTPYEIQKRAQNGDVYPRTLAPQIEDLAWAAAFFEGEGHFTLNRKKRIDRTYLYIFKAGVTQKDRALLAKFQTIVGVGKIGNVNTNNGCSEWYTTKRGEAEYVYGLFKPWLSERRINRATECIEQAEASRRNNRKTQGDSNV